jgi:hypothetical protein
MPWQRLGAGGWYHSHPNLGVAFSGTDCHMQRAFFSNPHSLRLVIDVRREEKWFIGSSSSDDVEPGQGAWDARNRPARVRARFGLISKTKAGD